MLPSNPHLCLILMSASVDAARFSQYFGVCPIIYVPGLTYPVKTYYLEDVLSIIKSGADNHELSQVEKLSLDDAINLAWSNDEWCSLLELVYSKASPKVFDYQHSLIGLNPLMVFARKGKVGYMCMLLSLGENCHLRAKDGTTALEISEKENQQVVVELLKKHMDNDFSNQEGKNLLDKYLATVNPKVVDVVLIEQLIKKILYVIDIGLVKEKSYDPYHNVFTLQSSWISKASAKQREGCASRCHLGICYRLYSKVQVASLPDFQVPEIKRMLIEELYWTLDPPGSESVRNAVGVLQEIGALSVDEQLTQLGQKLGCLPIHPSTGRMLIFSILMICLDPALTLACAFEFNDPFVHPILPDEKKRASAARSELGSLYGGCGDQFAIVAAFECWHNSKEMGLESRFCSQYFVSQSIMNKLSGMRKNLAAELYQNGLIHGQFTSYCSNAHDPVTHSTDVLPHVLRSTVDVLACIMSCHGLSGIPQTSDCANTHQINPSEVKVSEPEAHENPSNQSSQNAPIGLVCSTPTKHTDKTHEGFCTGLINHNDVPSSGTSISTSNGTENPAHINDDATMTDVTPSKDPDPTMWWDASKGGRYQKVSVEWIFTEVGWIKSNVDGSYKALQHLTSCSGVFRDSTGSWCFGFALNLGNLSCGSSDSTKPGIHQFIVVSEMWSVLTALKLVKEKGISQLWIETDSTSAVDYILNKRVQKGDPFAPLVESILELMIGNWTFRVSHCYREANTVADWLSKYAHTTAFGLHVLDVPPHGCIKYLTDDSTGVYRLRTVRVIDS
ncbi:hypothetical protein JHK84_049915 [Glycine max]|nr:hypothetical protein JHK85_050632 [Glycine max]KAG5094327.1 hypothetical protein JHK84_049915 [Glycine max]